MKHAPLILWIASFFIAVHSAAGLESMPYEPPKGIPVEGDSAENRALLAKGFLSVTLRKYGADPTGAVDATSAIQQAIHDGYEQCLGVFFPSGVYQISDTLYCGQEDFTDLRQHWLVGSQARRDAQGRVIRPVLRLANHAPGFNPPKVNEQSAKHIIAFWCQRGEKDYQQIKARPDLSLNRGAVGFNLCIKGIDIENGSGNPGAIGLSMWSAQNSSIEDVRIDMNHGADAGFAAFGSLPGVAGGATNIEAIGGRFGIFWISGTRFPTVVGLTMRGQEELAIANYAGDSPLAITGFKIHERQPPAIVSTDPHNPNGGGMTLIDGTFEFETAGTGAPAIDNTQDRSFYLNNIAAKGATQLIRSAARSPVKTEAGPAWSRIAEYYYGMSAAKGTYYLNRPTRRDPRQPPQPSTKEPKAIVVTAHASTLLEGALNLAGGQEGVGRSERISTPPADLITRHLYGDPEKFPWFENAGVINARDFGVDGRSSYDNAAKRWVGRDDTAALQAVLDRALPGEVVFLPKGVYLVSATLRLKKNTQLIGAGKNLAWIVPDTRKWKPTSTAVILDTPDDAAGTVHLAWFRVSWPCEEGLNWFQPLRWRVGRDSIIRGIRMRPLWFKGDVGVPKTEFLIEGHGGGRIYSLIMGAKSGEDHPEHRRVLVRGTTEPLRFYHFNIEDQKAGWGGEFRDASNVAIYGFKSENLNVLLFKNCRNVWLTNYGGGGPEVRFENTHDVLAANWAAQNAKPVGPTEYLLREISGGKTQVIQARNEFPLIVFKRGTVDRAKIHPVD